MCKKLLILFIAIPFIAFGQEPKEKDLKNEIRIEGNVRDVNGVPLIGVSILVNGTTNVIKTNFDGNFYMNADKEALLILSYPGLKTKEVNVENKINITLENEIESESKVLSKSDIRKKRRADMKARSKGCCAKNVEPLDEFLLKAAGTNVKRAIIKNRENPYAPK
jgi:hypothetical protein